MLFPFIFLSLGLALVIKGADYLIDGASSLAKHMHVSEIVIGLTIVAFGTSAPELIINIFSSIAGKNDLVLGNILGANMLNILFTMGIAGLIYPLDFNSNSIRKEIPFSLLATLVFFVLANDRFIFNTASNRLSRIDGLILLSLLGFFFYYTFGLSKIKSLSSNEIKEYSLLKSWIFVIIGFAFLFVGGKVVVNYAVIIARKLQVSEKLIGLTVLSIGTTLPELTTTVVAAVKKRSDLIIGNLLGSNIFNLLLIMGISTVISPISYDTVFNFDVAVLGLGTVFLLISIIIFKPRKLDRREALVLLIFYIVYMVLIISRK
ncbi:MAG: Calcium/sodium antiporter [Acidobacteriota bacterium]|nr:Calcium/sodium antiporter [Acidobacteriota bacterium]